MQLELCIDSIEEALVAKKYGFDRVELCSALEVGGLTPSTGLVKKCSQIEGIETHVMIRPRAGDFTYSKDEIEIMKTDIDVAANAGAKGVVFGILNSDSDVDIPTNEKLISVAQSLGLETTFHRAFDLANNPLTALNQIIQLDFDRLLTSGQKPKVIDGINLIKKLVIQSQNKIQIMAGSGVNHSNSIALQDTGIDALHFTARKSITGSLHLEMGASFEPDELKIQNILSKLNTNNI